MPDRTKGFGGGLGRLAQGLLHGDVQCPCCHTTIEAARVDVLRKLATCDDFELVFDFHGLNIAARP